MRFSATDVCILRGEMIPGVSYSQKWIERRMAASRRYHAPEIITAVWLVPAAGVARAASIGRDYSEITTRNALGTADELNADRGWTLRDNHDGPLLAVSGRRLQAFDHHTLGPLVRWLPDMRSKVDAEIVRRIDAGVRGVSMKFLATESKQAGEFRFVKRARLIHLALLPAGTKPAYRQAIALAFRSRPDDPIERTAQMEAVAAASRSAF